MKRMKTTLSLVICICFLFGCMAIATSAAATDTASITITNQDGTNATIQGKTLNLFKIFEVTKSADGANSFYDWIKETDGSNRFEDFFIGDTSYAKLAEGSTINDVVQYIDGLKSDASNFSKMTTAFHAYLHDDEAEYNRLLADTENFKTSGVIASTSYTFSNLSLGYYVIFDATVFDVNDPTPAVRSAAMLSHSGQNVIVHLKADRPHLVKYVDDSNDPATPDWKAGTTAAIGDIVDFKIVTKIPNHEHYGSYTFEISDVMSDHFELVVPEGETLDKGLTVSVIDPADADPTKIEEVDYDIVYGNGLSAEEQTAGVDFKVVVNNTIDVLADTTMEITYKAKVLQSAEKANLNTATLTYSNDPNSAASFGKTQSAVTVSLWQLTLTKYFEDTDGMITKDRLTGAEFKIYKMINGVKTLLKFATSPITSPVNNVTYTKYTLTASDAVVDGTAVVDTLKTLNSGQNVDDGKTDVGYTDGEYLGQILVFGLDEGTYIIEETEAPDGFQRAEGTFEVILTDAIGGSGAVSNATLETVARDSNLLGKFTRVHLDESTLKSYVGITNVPGASLPETGGMGTTLFTIFGVVLMAGAVAFFTLRKRSSAA